MTSTLSLDGRVAFVTGSTRGIGWSAACLLASHGAAVVLNGHRDPKLLDSRVVEIRNSYGVEAEGYLADMADPGAVEDSYRKLFKRFRRLDILVNNAGILGDALIGMIPNELVSRTLAVNTHGPILNIQCGARLMMRGKSGSIINVTSIVGVQGNEGQTVYAASKAALIGLTKAAAKELAPKNIRVNAVAPGYIATDMIQHLDEETHAARLGSIKMGRVGSAEDVARAILFFASDLSSYVTGQVLGVDGGMVMA